MLELCSAITVWGVHTYSVLSEILVWARFCLFMQTAKSEFTSGKCLFLSRGPFGQCRNPHASSACELSGIFDPQCEI